MSVAANMKRSLTVPGGIAIVCLTGGTGLLALQAIDVARGAPFNWQHIGIASFQIWMFSSIVARGGIFKDNRTKPAQ